MTDSETRYSSWMLVLPFTTRLNWDITELLSDPGFSAVKWKEEWSLNHRLPTSKIKRRIQYLEYLAHIY